MKILKTERRLCTCCMEEHDVSEVVIKEETVFKEEKVAYEACYMYCDAEETLYANEEQLDFNDRHMKDAYRKSVGLLTSSDICSVRKKFGISQKDLCILLGWGEKTITRYESHQVQDRAHDSILRKLEADPEWLLALLNGAKNNLPHDSYQKYLENAMILFENDKDAYLKKAIEADYVVYQGDADSHGNAELCLNKVVDIIRYFASSEDVTGLYKVKLMKLLWYADALSYKKTGHAITGLVYKALPMGAVPIGHNSFIDLKGVPCEEVDMGESYAYHFSLDGVKCFPSLSAAEIDILDAVISRLGKMSKNEIIEYMHKEQAYVKTHPYDVISFTLVSSLQM